MSSHAVCPWPHQGPILQYVPQQSSHNESEIPFQVRAVIQLPLIPPPIQDHLPHAALSTMAPVHQRVIGRYPGGPISGTYPDLHSPSSYTRHFNMDPRTLDPYRDLRYQHPPYIQSALKNQRDIRWRHLIRGNMDISWTAVYTVKCRSLHCTPHPLWEH